MDKEIEGEDAIRKQEQDPAEQEETASETEVNEASREKNSDDKNENPKAKKARGSQVRDSGSVYSGSDKAVEKTKPKKVTLKPKKTIKRPVLDYDPKKANSANLEFPTDIYGCCSKFRQEIIRSASRCCGYPDKMEILLAVILEAQRHIKAKHEENLKLFAAKRTAQREAVKKAAEAQKENN